MCISIILMIFIGGLTRLTGAGLAITEWNLISGIFLPYDLNMWEVEFDKYKQSPEYIQYNFGMNLEEFIAQELEQILLTHFLQSCSL